ncbi:ATP phosphoribosyltransferase [Clostridium cylindrosporum]|uniref:ATP phosphoribosyltransferase n=1 Tax=Clostridium cylindrosporum DSM 605 TaxID=1121307 RepID=A0A0J8DEE3_CLOCY|nr:ATP phosphoribosyltransferase [Clostridium cylindrosporum]KMT22594.1 ATP phosphoribosyltransferase HisG [Clostridium cylindrosporum DSM 605]
MDYINIALGKGRIAKKSIELLEKIGITFDDYSDDSRKLIFENKKDKVRLVFVKATDVPVYVERGAADIGVVGKDTLLEENRELYEILDLNFGKCKFSVAAPTGYSYGKSGKLKVATKYPHVAKMHFSKKGEDIDIIKLNGSVELAPLVGLSDVIVDIVETGTTLKENGLVVIEDICSISAKMVVNRASFKVKNEKIEEIIEKTRALVKEDK